jgi:hypothetical protein
VEESAVEESGVESKRMRRALQKRQRAETDYELRWQKLNCFISSLLEFMYISNYAESRISDFTQCRYPSLFERICLLSISDFTRLIENQVFRTEVLEKTILTFNRYESHSREVCNSSPPPSPVVSSPSISSPC